MDACKIGKQLTQSVNPVEVCVTIGVQIVTDQCRMIRQVAMRSIYADGRLATLVVVHKRIDPLPDDFMLSGHLKQSTAGTLADKYIA